MAGASSRHIETLLPTTLVATIISETRVKISRVVGYNQSVVVWSANKDFTHNQFRVVSSSDATVDQGYQIEQDQAALVVLDDFNRADGALGDNWAATSDGGLSISANAVHGPGLSWKVSYWAANSFGDDQFSQATVVAQPQLAGWIGLSVRTQTNGNVLRCFYFNNGGTYELRLGRRISGATVTTATLSLGATPLPLGTVLTVQVQGSTLTLFQDGVQKLQVDDTNIPSGGAPGIISYGSAAVDNWSGGTIISSGTADTEYQSTLTDDEIEAVSSSEGTKIVKLFVQNADGWSE